MQKRKLGKAAGKFGHWARLHGDEFFLRSAQRQTGDDLSPSHGRGTRRHIFDTAEVYGPSSRKNSWAKPLSFHGQVVIATKFGFKIIPGQTRLAGLDSRPEHIKESGRGLAQAAQD